MDFYKQVYLTDEMVNYKLKERAYMLHGEIKEEKITRTAIVIISDVLDPETYEYSKLYDKEFTHGYRKAKTIKK